MFNKIKYLIKDGFFHILGGSFLIKVIGFASSICVVRLISKEDYGYLTYTDNLYSYVSIIAGLGMATAIIVKCNVNNSDQENMKYFKFATLYGGIIQGVAAIGVLIYFFFISKKFEEATIFVVLLFLYQPLSYLIQCFANFVRAYQKNKLYSKAILVQSIVLFASSIGITLLFGKIGIVIGRYLGVVGFLFIVKNFIKTKKYNIEDKLNKNEIKSFVSISISLLITSFFSEIMYSNETFLVSFFSQSEETLADYRIATLIPVQIMFVTQSLLVYFIPKFVELKDKKNDLFRYVKRVLVLNTGIIIVICVISIILTPFMIKLLYGYKYIGAIDLSIKFWIAYSLNAIIRMIPLNVLATTGFEKFNAIFSIFGAVIHFVCTFISLKFLGMAYLPLAISTVYIFIGSASYIYMKRVLTKDFRGEDV